MDEWVSNPDRLSRESIDKEVRNSDSLQLVRVPKTKHGISLAFAVLGYPWHGHVGRAEVLTNKEA